MKQTITLKKSFFSMLSAGVMISCTFLTPTRVNATVLTTSALLTSPNLEMSPAGIPEWDSIKTWNWVPGQDWMISDRKTDLVYDAQHNLLSYSQEMSNPPSTGVTKTKVSNTYNSINNRIASKLEIFFGTTWVTYGYDTVIYDANNNEISDLQQVMNSGFTAMITQRHLVSTYDTHNNRTSFVDSSWNGSDFDVVKINNSYDADNNTTWHLEQSWLGTAWMINKDRVNTYDTHHNKITQEDSIWYNGFLQTIDRNKYTNTYDANTNLTTSLDSANSGKITKTAYAYDANNNRLSVVTQGWNGINSFVRTNSKAYTFDAASNLTSQVDSVFHWSGGTASPILQSIGRSFFTYDAHNNQTSDLSQYWAGGTVFKDNTLITYTYDATDNKYVIVRKNYDNTGTVTSGDSTYFYNSGTPTGINKIAEAKPSVKIYPNPANQDLYVSSNILMEKLEIYNVTGVLQSSSNNNTIDISGLPSGIYFVKVYMGNNTSTRKFIKQ